MKESFMKTVWVLERQGWKSGEWVKAELLGRGREMIEGYKSEKVLVKFANGKIEQIAQDNFFFPL